MKRKVFEHRNVTVQDELDLLVSYFNKKQMQSRETTDL